MKKHKITDLKGRTRKIACIACAIQSSEAEHPGLMAEAKYFTAEQDYEFPIPGFVIIVSKRHICSIDEFTEDEQQNFVKFLCRLRAGMRQVLKIEHVYIIQEEDTATSHFHVWLFPRYQWMKNKFGRKIESVKPIMEYARKNLKTKSDLKKVDAATEKLRKYFLTGK